MRCVQGMSETTQDYEDKQLHAHSCVHQVCHVIVGFHVLCVDLGFHVVIGVGRLTVQQEGFIRQLYFTTHTQFQVQSSFLLDVVVRLCPVIVNSICIPNSCIFHIAKTGLLRCCLYRSSGLRGFAIASTQKQVTSSMPCARSLSTAQIQRAWGHGRDTRHSARARSRDSRQPMLELLRCSRSPGQPCLDPLPQGVPHGRSDARACRHIRTVWCTTMAGAVDMPAFPHIRDDQ